MSDYPTAQDIARYRRHDLTPDLSPAEAAKAAAFDAAPTPPEVREAALLEEVARAIRRSWLLSFDNRDDWDFAEDDTRIHYRRLAAAAVAAYRAQDGDLRNRMADVADNLDYYAGKTDGGTYAGGLSDAAGHIRDALAGVQDGGAEEAVRRQVAEYAWSQGYESCRRGDQKRNPYRAALATRAGDDR
jgi:hypothetical protein